MTDNLETWTSRIAWTALVAIVVGGISWGAWMTVEIQDKIDRTELNQYAPYTRDESWIKHELFSLRETNKSLAAKLEGEFSQTVKANTEAIIQLKEQMKYNNKIWEKVIGELEKNSE